MKVYKYYEAKKLQDKTEKTVFGETGNWDGDDVIDLTFKQPAARTFLIRELIKFYLTEEAVDEAYIELSDDPDANSCVPLIIAGHDVIVTRTFSKIHGLAALRLGWAYAQKPIIDVLHRVRGPFNVNMAAIEAGTAAIQDRDFMQRSVAHNDEWVAYLRQQIGGLGLEVTPSVCNFVLIHFPETPGKMAADADAYLTARGLIIRGVEPYGLLDALRAPVGTEGQTRRWVAASPDFRRA